MGQRNGSKKLIDKESVLDIYSDLYDVFDDSPGIINELHKVYDRLNALGSDQHPGEWRREVLGSTSGYGTTVMYQCSECGSMSISQYKYCPNCGKRMLKGDNK